MGERGYLPCAGCFTEMIAFGVKPRLQPKDCEEGLEREEVAWPCVTR